MNPSVRLPPWMLGVRKWEEELRAELAELPGTLRLLRESAANMQRISQRLLDATEAIEQITALTAGMVEARRRLDDAAGSLRDRVTGTDRTEAVSTTMGDIGEAVAAMADLNPFLRRPSRPGQAPKRKPKSS